ncbi:hypothetical protein D3C72_1668050 [compost metagenome]
MPLNIAATARYGLASAPASRYSMRWLAWSAQGKRSATVRLLCPQEARSGTCIPGRKRRNALTLGANIAIEAGISASMPAITCVMVALNSPGRLASRLLPCSSCRLI